MGAYQHLCDIELFSPYFECWGFMIRVSRASVCFPHISSVDTLPYSKSIINPNTNHEPTLIKNKCWSLVRYRAIFWLHDSFICVMWRSDMCGNMQRCAWHNAYVFVPWLFHMREGCHDLYVCGSLRDTAIYGAKMQRCAWHNTSIFVPWHIHVCHVNEMMTWLVSSLKSYMYVYFIVYVYISYISFITFICGNDDLVCSCMCHRVTQWLVEL